MNKYERKEQQRRMINKLKFLYKKYPLAQFYNDVRAEGFADEYESIVEYGRRWITTRDDESRLKKYCLFLLTLLNSKYLGYDSVTNDPINVELIERMFVCENTKLDEELLWIYEKETIRQYEEMTKEKRKIVQNYNVCTKK